MIKWQSKLPGSPKVSSSLARRLFRADGPVAFAISAGALAGFPWRQASMSNSAANGRVADG